MGKFNQIMEHLNPRVIIEKTEVPHDNARAQFSMRESTVESHREFETCLISYVAHHTQETLGMALPPELCLDKARKYLENSIGYEEAVFIALSGTEGGMPHCLNQVNNGFKRDGKQAWFSYILSEFIDPLSFEDVVGVMTEFKERIGSYAPNSFGFISPEQMAGNYRDIIWNYVDSISRYRNLWNYS